MPRIVLMKQLPAMAGLLAIALAGSFAMLPARADDAPPGGYPSWQDVENAKQSEAGKSAEVANINDLLSGLQSTAEALGTAAVASAAEYAVTDAALQAASSKVDVLNAQVARVNGQLGQYKKELGGLAAQAYKTGATNMGFFVALDAVQTNNIQGLNIVQIISDKTASLVQKSAAAEKASQALADQQQAAKAERERLAGEAKAKLEAAQAAQQAMAQQVAQQQQHSQELTAQLASLKGTTAAVEDGYRQGQAAQAAYEAAQAAKRAAAEEQARQQADAAAKAAALAAQAPAYQTPQRPAGGSTPSPPPAVVYPSIPGGAVNDPAGAKSYASGRLSAFGWGPDQFQCLLQLWTKESDWLTTATNPSSGAYGIAQALPAGKYASAGSDWLTSYRTQIEWGLGYIGDRYGSPCGAWSHEVAMNWY
jgi:septal ring factor EnvC (AmiA/AmiB activator)